MSFSTSDIMETLLRGTVFRIQTAISQLTQLVNMATQHGLRSVSVRTWRMWVLIVLGMILGDHLGLWELHDLFSDRKIDMHEIGVIIAGLGALFSALSDKDES